MRSPPVERRWLLIERRGAPRRPTPMPADNQRCDDEEARAAHSGTMVIRSRFPLHAGFMSVRYHPHELTSRPAFEPHNGIAGRALGPACLVSGVPLCVGLRRRLLAQQAQGDNGGRKQAQRGARRRRDSIRVDGRLDEEAWRSAPAVTDFVQKEPVEGAPPTDRMEVRFAYDDGALYVGARMYSQDPVRAPLGRRDEGEQAERLLVSLDTYLDRRTASTFGVTASGVRLDHYYASDDECERR